MPLDTEKITKDRFGDVEIHIRDQKEFVQKDLIADYFGPKARFTKRGDYSNLERLIKKSPVTILEFSTKLDARNFRQHYERLKRKLPDHTKGKRHADYRVIDMNPHGVNCFYVIIIVDALEDFGNRTRENAYGVLDISKMKVDKMEVLHNGVVIKVRYVPCFPYDYSFFTERGHYKHEDQKLTSEIKKLYRQVQTLINNSSPGKVIDVSFATKKAVWNMRATLSVWRRERRVFYQTTKQKDNRLMIWI